ncbi:hypothetical protein Mal15_44760 [Stieleria maiorica]|uniref:Uncharacterized protein n=1 Tax=Stieleria maiorica TaxID=2795974 RepID=A0A5B9MLK9_9BACT|nr:hypothetical protein Mal15_44760 [Stieleria maiorica]
MNSLYLNGRGARLNCVVTPSERLLFLERFAEVLHHEAAGQLGER